MELKSSDFFIQKDCGIDHEFITDWCIQNENHPFFAHDEDGTATPNQFSNNLPTNEELTVEMEMIIILGKLQ